MPPISPSLDLILNLSKYHREHEKFNASAPLRQALAIQQSSNLLKTLADRWAHVGPEQPSRGNPYLGCEDLNEVADIQHTGVQFLEGEAEPVEISQLKNGLRTPVDDFSQTGQWLTTAMASAWEVALPLVQVPPLARVLGERHRIIANNWQAANLSSLAGTLIERALLILEKINFSPHAVRGNLAGPRVFAEYLHSASETLDRAADITAESATLTHDNERGWRVFRERVEQVAATKRTGETGADSALVV